MKYIYYARPFSYNPEESRVLYKQESQLLHDITGMLVVCTIPLTDYKLNCNVEKEILEIAATLIQNATYFVWQGESHGVLFEKEMAKKYGVEIKEYGGVVDEWMRGWK
jgi:hypothetical protein